MNNHDSSLRPPEQMLRRDEPPCRGHRSWRCLALHTRTDGHMARQEVSHQRFRGFFRSLLYSFFRATIPSCPMNTCWNLAMQQSGCRLRFLRPTSKPSKHMGDLIASSTEVSQVSFGATALCEGHGGRGRTAPGGSGHDLWAWAGAGTLVQATLGVKREHA